MTLSSEHRVSDMTVAETSRRPGDNIFGLQATKFKVTFKSFSVTKFPSLCLFQGGPTFSWSSMGKSERKDRDVVD